jgi:tRNA nucleotidyltransferase/poly(A) polymerase
LAVLFPFWTVKKNFKAALDEQPVFAMVAEAAREMGVQGFVVGGYPRDLLMKRPSKDIDFVCVGSGIEWAERVGQKLGQPVTVFKNVRVTSNWSLSAPGRNPIATTRGSRS